MAEVMIRQARLSDVPAMARIETESFESPWSAAEITKDVTAGGNVYVAAAIEGDGCVGYAEFRDIAGEAQIYNIAVDPGTRGRGIGGALLRHIVNEAEDRGCSVMNLEVRASNKAAISLYEKTGFRVVGRRKLYYEGREDAVLMDMPLGKIEIDVDVL